MAGSQQKKRYACAALNRNTLSALEFNRQTSYHAGTNCYSKCYNINIYNSFAKISKVKISLCSKFIFAVTPWSCWYFTVWKEALKRGSSADVEAPITDYEVERRSASWSWRAPAAVNTITEHWTIPCLMECYSDNCSRSGVALSVHRYGLCLP